MQNENFVVTGLQPAIVVRKESSLDILEECLHIAYRARKASLECRSRNVQESLAKEKYLRSNVKTTSDTYIDLLTDEEKQVLEAQKKKSPEKPRRALTSQFTNLESQSSDMIATEALRNFKVELSQWWKTNSTKRGDEDCRAEFAEVLTEKFLCQKLDPLPSSPIVAHTRRTVSAIIEDFATNGHLDLDKEEYATPPATESAYKAYSAKVKETAQTSATLVAVNEKELQTKAPEKKATEEEKAALEKAKIKQQYEQYMRGKKLAEDDLTREQAMETHLDDIRSLLSSMRPPGV